MHERGHITRAIAEFLAEHDRPLTGIEVRLGPGMVEEVARAAWADVVAGSRAQEAEVTWSRAADLLQCVQCGCEYPGAKLDRCPGCGGNGLVVEPAPEISIVARNGPGDRTPAG